MELQHWKYYFFILINFQYTLYEQPLHCGFGSDRGGNDISVHWYRRKQTLHHVRQIPIFSNHITSSSSVSAINIVFIYHICVQVWDASIIETEIERFYDDIDDFVDAIQKNITVLCAGSSVVFNVKICQLKFYFF